jgi:hypothetical protein
MNTDQAERVLLDVGQVLDACGVPFFLILGTCLGVVREGRILAHDNDIDLGVLVEHLSGEAMRLKREFVQAKFAVRIVQKPCLFDRALVVERDGVKCDIAGFIRHEVVRFSPSSFLDYCLVYPAALIETTEGVEYLGRQWRVPSPARFYLEKHYGPGWQTSDPKYKPSMGKARIYGFLSRVRAGS